MSERRWGHGFSTVANALEINRKVLYVRNERGHIVGRKLVALRADGVLFGFHSYGMATCSDSGRGSPWIKILLDTLCRDIAARTGIRLASPIDEEQHGEAAEATFALFFECYFDAFCVFRPS